MDNSKEMKVKLNPRGWAIYREKNGFADSNIDSEGNSYFSIEYFHSLFFPLSSDEFAYEVVNIKEDKVIYVKMLKSIFCYRILADAGMARDGKGNKASCYTQIKLDADDLRQPVYKTLHENNMKGLLALQLSIAPELLECISIEEYNENHGEDE